MADYSLLGSFSSGGASALSGDLLTKLRDADQASALYHIDKQLENITGVDAETGDELDAVGESFKMMIIKAQATDLLTKASSFDLASTDSTVFDSVAASTTGSSAVFDAIDVSGLEPGTNNITVTQLAQRDVYQSGVWTQANMDASFPIVSNDADGDGNNVGVDGIANSDDDDYSAADLALMVSSKISVEVDGETYDFDIFKDTAVSAVSELNSKTLTELADEINANEKLIASVETVGTDQFRLVIKSTDSGTDNALTITQTNVSLGFGDKKSTTIDDFTDTMTLGGRFSIDGEVVVAETGGMTYDQLMTEIKNFTAADGSKFDAIQDGNTIKLTSLSGSSFTTLSEGTMDLTFSDSSQTLTAQNLNANVDGIDYNVSSNTLTIQGNLTMTAVELGDSTINITRDTTAVLTGIESIIESYNALVDLVEAEVSDPDSPISDISSLKSITSDVKNLLFGSYGLNSDQNLFNLGMEVDLQGHLSIDSSKFADGLADSFNDLKNMFLGNTTSTDLASTDNTKYMGMGTLLKTYLDDLDGYDGIFTRYDTSIATRQEQLEKEREAAIESLDIKYATLGAQYAAYGSTISNMEAAFSGMSMMIQQSVTDK